MANQHPLGLGVGPGFQLGVLVVQNVLPHEWIPVGSACVQFFQSLGGAIFIAVAQALFQNGLAQSIEENAPGISPDVFIHGGASDIRGILHSLHADDLLDAVLNAYLVGLRNSFYISVAASAMAFVMVAGLSWKKMEKSPAAAAPTSSEDVETGKFAGQEGPSAPVE